MKSLLPAVSICLSVLCFQAVSAQSHNDRSLEQQFIRYQQQHLQEKVYLHTDKDFYLAGETIWFKVYITDAFFHRPLAFSSIVYIEVIDRNKKPVLQTAVDVDLLTATGNGSISIPSSVLSDKYVVRAYTNWMKNYGEACFFSKTFTVVNTVAGSLARRSDQQNDSVLVNLYPEGGNLIDGLTSKVAFKLTGKNGEAVNGSGIIRAANNDTILSFSADKNGTGFFYFTPQKAREYAVILQNKTHPVKVHWPVVFEEGYVMELKDQGNRLLLSVKSNIKNAGTVYLLAYTRQVVKSFQQLKPDARGYAEFIIDKSLLGDGVSHITLFNDQRQPVCERLYFKQPEKKAVVSIHTNKENYAVREYVTGSVIVKDDKGMPVKANMSASVFLLDSLQQQPAEDIRTYLLLTSELGNRIDNALQYFNSRDSNAVADIDNVMLVNGWSRFRWEDIVNEKEKCFEYLPEKEGQVIRAKLVNRSNGRPAGNTAAFLSVPGEKFTLANAVSNDAGIVNFIFKPARQRNEMILQTVSATDRNYFFEPDPYYAPVSSITIPATLRVKSQYKNYLEQRSTYVQVENSFDIEKKHLWNETSLADTTVFYGHSGQEYKLDEYTRFLTMEEVLKEFVADLSVKKSGDRFYFRVKDKVQGAFFGNDPLILIDGVPVMDAGKMMLFDPLKIKSIDIVASRYFHQSQVYEGIVSFKTYNGDLAGFELDPNAVVVEYNALQKRQQFYEPVYDTEEKKKSRLPDFRNVLLWMPDMTSAADGTSAFHFYTSGCTGRFLIFLQGLSGDGLPIAAMKTIEVTP